MNDKKTQKLILLGLGASVFVVCVIFTWLLRRDGLFPSDKNRYDITTLWVAPASMVCPQVSRESDVSRLVACLNELDKQYSDHDQQQNSDLPARNLLFKPINIPPLPQSPLNHYPKIAQLFSEQGATEALETFDKKEPLLFRILVPKEYFTANNVSAEPFVLTFAQLREGRVCYLGSCDFFLDRHSYIGVGPPLFARQLITSAMVTVWIYLADTSSHIGLNLEHGIFVTRSIELRPVHLIHAPIIQGTRIFGSFLTLAIALMALLYAWFWSEYVDFSAFAALASVYYIATTIRLITYFLPNKISYPHLNTIAAQLGEILVLVASIAFAFATLRPKQKKFWSYFLGAIFFTLIFIPPMIDFLNSYKTSEITSLKLAILTASIPPLIAIGGSLLFNSPDKFTGSNALQKVARRRRYNEQVLYGITLFLLGLPTLIQQIQYQYGLTTYNLSSPGSIMLFPVFAILLYYSSNKFRDSAIDYRDDLIRMTKQAAVGEFIQMLAHDIRKPFSLLRIGLDMMAKAKSLDDHKAITARLSPQVNKSLKTISNMLNDIMDVNSNPILNLESIDIRFLIEQGLKEVFESYPDADINFTYELNAICLLMIDEDKLLRVIDNILENAVLAMQHRGHIWFHSEFDQIPAMTVSLTIGNSGSYISESQRTTIFDAFNVSNQRQGRSINSGLGLAVAQKFVQLHGGTIACMSDRQKGTEFKITLPFKSTITGTNKFELPLHSRQINTMVPKLNKFNQDPKPNFQSEMDDSQFKRLEQLARPLRILLLDDETLYNLATTDLFTSKYSAHVIAVESAQDALKSASINPPDLLICDVDLGSYTENGLHVCQRLRSLIPNLYICIHSNRSLAEDHKRATQAGADIFLSKPLQMSDADTLIANVLKKLESIAEDLKPPISPSPPQNQASPLESADLAKPLIAIIDDDIFVREAWINILVPAPTIDFSGPTQFIKWVETNVSEINRLTCIILDLHFDDDIDGLTFAREFRATTDTQIQDILAKIPIILCTDGHDSVSPHDAKSVDLIIPKDPLNLTSLLQLIATKKQKPSLNVDLAT